MEGHYLLNPGKLHHIVPGLALELVLNGASWRGELQSKGDLPGLWSDLQILDEATADNVLPEVRVYDARQLPQDLLLPGLCCDLRRNLIIALL